MPYRLFAKESVQNGVRRIAGEQIERALGELQDTALSRAEVIHQVRKRCKKVRGALRLVRPSIQDRYSEENAWYRRIARSLSAMRDATAMVEAYDALIRRSGDDIDGRVVAPIRGQLKHREEVLTSDGDGVATRRDAVEDGLVQGYKRIAFWTLEDDGFDAVSGGLRKTYVRARTAMHAAYERPSPETFHAWRKRVKYHWYHMRLLRDVWPKVMRARRDQVDELGAILGEHHNLSVLRRLLLDEPESFAKEETVVTFTGLIDHRLIEIQAGSTLLGQRLFAENPKRFVRRVSAYWAVWRSG
jgi:CHAD domain-containing protein